MSVSQAVSECVNLQEQKNYVMDLNKEAEEFAEENITVVDEKEDPKRPKFDGPDFRTWEAKNEENLAVAKFQEAHDMSIMEKIYLNRVPTLKWWATKNKYLDNNSYEDVLGELTKIFVRTVYKYKTAREKEDDKGKMKTVKTHFNTYLYYALDHSMCNLYNRRLAKKRCPLEMDVENISSILLSLNFSYGDGDSEFTLQDVIPDEATGWDGKVVDSICFNETLDVLHAENEPDYIREAFVKLSEGNSLASILKEHNVKKGYIPIDHNQVERFKQISNKNVVKKLVADRRSLEQPFELVGYEVQNKRLRYIIEFGKTTASESIVKKIRSLRRNKDSYMRHIRG